MPRTVPLCILFRRKLKLLYVGIFYEAMQGGIRALITRVDLDNVSVLRDSVVCQSGHIVGKNGESAALCQIV